MTELSQDEIAEFSALVAELQQRLEQSFTAHDHIIARQAANEEENSRLRAELAAVGEIRAPLASIHDAATHAAELSGKLRDTLTPAALEDTVREEVDGLMRSLTSQLEKLTENVQRARAMTGISPLPREGAGDSAADAGHGASSGDSCSDPSSDSWAAEITALAREFPDQDFAAGPQAVPSQDKADAEQSDQQGH